MVQCFKKMYFSWVYFFETAMSTHMTMNFWNICEYFQTQFFFGQPNYFAPNNFLII